MSALKLCAFSVASLMVLSTAVQAQNVHISRLYEQVLENIEYTGAGYTLDSFGVVRLNEGKQMRVVLDVPAGASIVVMGDCDEDCFDLDVGVYTDAGKLLGEDRLDDYYPIVDLESVSEGRIAIEMDLVDCDANYCYAAYSVFAKIQ